MPVVLKRAYEKPSRNDGVRVLVERLWPRGIGKKEARIDLWLKDLAPSHELRRWFHARPSMWRQFRERYLRELRAPEAQSPLQQLYDLLALEGKFTLVFGSRDTEHNSAVVLKELLEGMRKPPGSSGPGKAAAIPMRARARR
jgi:uncharacterized protein YeaO (DUF488 family)